MNTNLANRITMLKTTGAYLDANSAIWNSMTPMQAAVQTYKQKLAAIDDATRKQQTPSGATEEKAAARDALEDVALRSFDSFRILNSKDIWSLRDPKQPARQTPFPHCRDHRSS